MKALLSRQSLTCSLRVAFDIDPLGVFGRNLAAMESCISSEAAEMLAAPVVLTCSSLSGDG